MPEVDEATQGNNMAPEIIFGWTMLALVILTFVFLAVLKAYTRFTVGRCKSKASMKGKTVIITGSNTGIGKETAKELAGRDARVILACRNMQKAAEAAREIKEATGNDVILKQLDLCSFKSIRRFVEDIKATEQRLDVLINNAGLMTYANREETEDGYEASFQTNHLGPFLLTNLLLDLLKKSGNSRIVMVSSVGHLFGRINCSDLEFKGYWFPLLAYCDTKVANILFTVELGRRLQNTGVTVNACHPGFVATEIANRYCTLQNWIFHMVLKFYGKTPMEGAQTSVHLAVAEDVKNVSGKYFSDCKTAWAAWWATSPRTAEKLWQLSEKMTGLRQEA